MRFLEALALHLQTQIPELQSGVTLFVDRIPVTVVDGVMLRESHEGIEIDHETGLRKGRVSVIYRAKTAALGTPMMTRVTDALTFVPGSKLGDFTVKRMHASTEPRVYPISEGKNVEFSIDFPVVYVTLT